MVEHDENLRQPSPEHPTDPETQRRELSKRGVATHVDGQGTGDPTKRSMVEGQPEQGTKKPSGG